ncbi:MAG: molybdopterin molybdotransferase MoeA [Desulfobacterales bacterium]|nr:molybdopterin molybdotransferase MoeA [Desulfobacterales bacterium]
MSNEFAFKLFDGNNQYNEIKPSDEEIEVINNKSCLNYKNLKLISYSDALNKVLSEISMPLPIEEINVIDSLGSILRENIYSNHSIPPFSKATMDGFAVKKKDVDNASIEHPIKLEVIGTIKAGLKKDLHIQNGQAARIMTGAPVPQGADMVIMVEETRCSGAYVEILDASKGNRFILEEGADIKKGVLVLEKGVKITPCEMGMISGCGKSKIKVSKQPKIGIISTGDELAEPGTNADKGQIYDINGYSLTGIAKFYGADAEFIGIVRDTYRDLMEIFAKTKGYDILLISGGVSVGDFDIVQETLLKAGVKKIFWRVKIKPGKPIFFGKRDKQLIFGLPGNPVSSMINFMLFIIPALDKMTDSNQIGLKTGSAILTNDFKLNPGRKKFLRGKLEFINEQLYVSIFSIQESGVFSPMLKADAIIEVSEESSVLNKGDKVKIFFMPFGI